MSGEKSKIKSNILLRVRMLYVLFVLVGLAVFIRLVWVQMLSSEIDYNAERLEGRIFTEQTISAQRGSILARNGEPLATSIFRYQVKFDFASPGFDSLNIFHEQTDSLAKLLSGFFGDRSVAEYQKMFRSEHAERMTVKFRKDTLIPRSDGFFSRWIDRLRGQEFKPVKLYDTLRDHTPVSIFPREVDYAEWQILSKYPVLNWNLGMVYNTEQTDQRIYPQGELARRTIGLIGDQGNYGIETVYKAELAGRDGKALRQRIARGFYGRVVGSGNVDPKDGADILTTLDPELQDVADKSLRWQLQKENAIWGTTIVMEVSTGEILAMANLGRNPDGATYSERENYALSRKTEPGSTFKLATMLALLEDARISMYETYDTENGQTVMVGGVKVRDSHGGYNNMDFKTAVAQSSNVYFAKAVWRHYADRKERYGDFLKRLHLDKTVGLEAFGEKKPTFQEWSKVPDPNSMLVRRSYGYRIEVSPIQMITFYNAMANGGRMISPVLIKELRRDGETVVKYRTSTLVDSICSPATLRKINECLREVSRSGTAAGFFKDSTKLLAAAKTGTAQYASGRIKYNDGYYIGSVAAYFPADKPRYTILTTIHTKRQNGKAFYGGPLSGPVVKAVAEYINNRDNARGRSVIPSEAKHHPRAIKGGDMAQMRLIADRFSPHVAFEKREGWGRSYADTLANMRITEISAEYGIMPDVTGMGLKDALFMLESKGLSVSFSGRGEVETQSIPAGDTISRGNAVNITLR